MPAASAAEVLRYSNQLEHRFGPRKGPGSIAFACASTAAAAISSLLQHRRVTSMFPVCLIACW